MGYIPMASWLCETVSEDTDNEILIKELKQKYFDAFPQEKEFKSHLIKILFPKSKSTYSRDKQNWVKLNCVYKGLRFKDNIRKPLNFEDIRTVIPPEWISLDVSSECISYGKLSTDTFNGNRILTKVNISSSSKIEIFVGDKEIGLADFQIKSTVNFDEISIQALFKCASCILLCSGIAVTDKENLKYASSRKCVKELHASRRYEKNPQPVIRHIDCVRVVSFTSRNSSCLKCRQFFSLKRSLEKSTNSQKDFNKENEFPRSHSKEDELTCLRKIAPNLSENQISLMHSQIVASNINDKRGMRWSKDLICMSLTIFNRSPGAYRDLVGNDWLRLPSEKLLTVYKHAVKQKPGVFPEMLKWMRQEADRQGLCPNGFYGGIIMDEMSIQEDLQTVNTKGGSELVGLVDMGEECKVMKIATEGKVQSQLANHVLQFMFSGITGFRWPFANYPNTQASPPELFVTTWKCIDALREWGFHPIFCCMDGSANNRAFLKMHFPTDNALESKMTAPFYRDPTQSMIFMMDPSHLLKKMRNSILSSGFLDYHVRNLEIDGFPVLWKMWIDAYEWDKNTNPFKIHHKLTEEHLFPNHSQKMRNKLAYDTLSDDMLNLMQNYQSSLLFEHGKDLNGAVTLLKHTSFLVRFFSDSRPIRDMGDERLKKLTESYSWFKAWENEICGKYSATPNTRQKELMTMETRQDLDFLYYGFYALVDKCIGEIGQEVIPSRVNSDIIENVFCQQRGLYHGCNTNPNYNSYRTGINSIILGQATVSKKANAGVSSAQPFSLCEKPLTQLKKMT